MKMKEFSWFDRIVGILGLLLGLPALFEFFKARFTNALLLVVLILLITGYLLYRYMDKHRKIREIRENSLFTHLEVETILSFRDPAGALATQTTKIHAQANHTGITQLWFRNLNADGQMNNFKMNGTLVPPNLVRRKAGGYEVCKEFDRPLRAGDTYKATLTYDLINSFPKEREGTTHVVFTATKKLKMRVEFHQQKVGREPLFFMERGGGIAEQLAPPRPDGFALEVESEGEDLQIGAYYTIEWVWN
jgi:hypothetical protein